MSKLVWSVSSAGLFGSSPSGRSPIGCVRFNRVRVLPLDLRRPIERLSGLPLRPSSVRFLLNSLPEEGEASSRARRYSEVAARHRDRSWLGARAGGHGLRSRRAWSDRRTNVVARARRGRPARHSSGTGGMRWLSARRRGGCAANAAIPIPSRSPARGCSTALAAGPWRRSTRSGWPIGWPRPTRNAGSSSRRPRWTPRSTSLGRDPGRALGLRPLVVDATWLHADRKRTLSACASDPNRLAR